MNEKKAKRMRKHYGEHRDLRTYFFGQQKVAKSPRRGYQDAKNKLKNSKFYE